MKRVIFTILIKSIFIFFLSVKVYSQTTNHQAYSLFILSFAKYSSWPTPNGELHIVVLGNTKVYDELLKQSGRILNGQVLKITQANDLAEVGQPQIIYLSDGKSNVLSDVMKAIGTKPVMVITEREGLYKKGAAFSFVILDNSTLRFDMNNTDLEKRQIKVSKSLITLANIQI